MFYTKSIEDSLIDLDCTIDGLSSNEAEIYLILLDLGESTVYGISDHSKISRPNIYDIII